MKAKVITGLKSDAMPSVVDRNFAVFITRSERNAITRYEFQVIQGNIMAKFAYILLSQIKYGCKKPSIYGDTLDI